GAEHAADPLRHHAEGAEVAGARSVPGGGVSGFWTPERVEDLKRLRQGGGSYAEIARQLGVSRNSVSGKVFRLDHPGHVRGRVQVRRERAANAETGFWDHRLFEPYARRKARRAAEAAAH